MSIRPLSFRRRTISDRTLRLSQPVPWSGGLQLTPLAVLNTIVDATNATANAVSSTWAQIFAASATASTDTIAAIWLNLSKTNSSGDLSALVDVAIGASGSETIIAQDIAVGGIATNGSRSVLLPVRVAGATRIAYRVRVATASQNWRLSNTTTSSAALLSSPFADRLPTSLDVLGTSQSTSSGTACSGSSGTWTQLAASTSRDYQAVILVPSGPGNGTAVTAAQAKLDLGIGGSGAEVQIASMSVQLTVTNGIQASLLASGLGIAGRFVPAGSRLAIRHNLASTPEALCGCVIGVPYV